VQSSSLSSLAYCRGGQVLEINFQDGSCYQFLGLPPEHFEALMAAASKGERFNRFIRNQFKYQRITRTHPEN
jgi:hypothetical protein